MSKIKLFVCCHELIKVPEHELLVPIQVGAALAGKYFVGFLHDDNGKNISDKNRSYCELTAQYWAWQNYPADYYGFFHYRRYLYPDMQAKYPYIIATKPNNESLNRLGYEHFADLIEKYDLIIAKAENMYFSVREHYLNSKFQHGKDLFLAEKIIKEKYSQYSQALDDYFNQSFCYFGNMYIMRRDIFVNYCAWLFDILEEFDQQVDCSGYSQQEMRVDGYLAERLLGVYYTKHKSNLRTLELPRVHFLDGYEYMKQRLLRAILPPSSRRRSVVKRLLVNK